MIKEELYINGESVELIKSLNPNLTFNIADIAKPDTRKADHSKTIELPASKKINKIFEHIFELDTDLQTFNPNLKTDVIYLVNGEIQIDGYLQLKSVKDKDGHIIYNCIIIGRVGNFIADLGTAELTDLDLSSLDHTYTATNITATWNLPLTTDYCYPMINYRGDMISNNSNVLLTIGPNAEEWKVTDFYPAVKAKKYLDLIFDSIGYSYTSTFLTSSFFNTLIIPFNGEDFKFLNTTILNRTFEVDSPIIQSSGSTNFNVVFDATFFSNSQMKDVGFTNEVRDAGNVFVNDVFTVPAGAKGFYSFNSMLQLQASFQSPTTSYTSTTFNGFMAVRIEINKYDNSENFIENLDAIDAGIRSENTTFTPGQQHITDANPSTTNEDYLIIGPGIRQVSQSGFAVIENQVVLNNTNPKNKYFLNIPEVFLEEGEKVKLEIFAKVVGKVEFNSSSQQSFPSVWPGATGTTGEAYALNILDGFFKSDITNTMILEGTNIPMNDTIPKKIKQKDYIMSLVKMFNLYIQPDSSNNKNLLIEPRDDFYSNDIIDWSTKIDKSQNVESKPMGALNFKEYLYTYKQDKDFYNELYFSTWNEVYGQDDFTLVNDFLNTEHKTEVIFSPTPSVGQSYHDRVIPTIYKYDDNSGYTRTESNIRILQWGGLKSSSFNWSLSTDNFLGSGANLLQSSYPYAGMYDDPYTPNTLLEFGLTNEIYYANVFDKEITFCDNTLFNKYYEKFIQEITDVNSKVVIAHFYLNATDIKNLSFSKQYYFEGQYFRLNKVENYNPINPITKCEFLKLNLSEVFTPSTTATRGGTGVLVGSSRAPLFSRSNNLLTNNNTRTSLNQRVVGSNNYISPTAYAINIIGSNNKIKSFAKNIEIQGSNNIINSGCNNVKLINSDNQTVITSNITYINNEITSGNGSTETITSFTKANLNVKQYFCDATGGNFTVDFSPTVTINEGKTWSFKKITASNTVTIDASTIGATIDGSNTYVLSANYSYVTIQYDGQNFLITSNN